MCSGNISLRSAAKHPRAVKSAQGCFYLVALVVLRYGHICVLVGEVGGQGLALMPELMFKEGAASAGCQVLQLEPAAKRTIGLACLSRTALSPAAREFVEHARAFARKR